MTLTSIALRVNISGVQARVVRRLSPAFAPLFVPPAAVGVAHSKLAPTHSCPVPGPTQPVPAPGLPHSTLASSLVLASRPPRLPAVRQLGICLRSLIAPPLPACADSCACGHPAARSLLPSAHSKARLAQLLPPLPRWHPNSSRPVGAAPSPIVCRHFRLCHCRFAARVSGS